MKTDDDLLHRLRVEMRAYTADDLLHPDTAARVTGRVARRQRLRMTSLVAVVAASVAVLLPAVVTSLRQDEPATDELSTQVGKGSEGLSLEEYEGGHVLWEPTYPGEVERVDFPVLLRNDTTASVTILSTSVPETDLVGDLRDSVLAPGERVGLAFTRTVNCAGPVLPADPRVQVDVRFTSGEERSINLPLTKTATRMYRGTNACAD